MAENKADLQQLTDRIRLLSLHREANPDTFPSKEQFRVAYLISVNEMLKVTVEPVKMAINARGMPNGAATKFDYWKLRKGYSPLFIGDSDFPILKKINWLRDSKWNELPVELENDQFCLDIFIAALITRRSVLDIKDRQNLSLDKTITGKFQWTSSSSGKKLSLSSRIGRDFTILPLAQIWYVDVSCGSTGILRTDLPAETIAKYATSSLKKRSSSNKADTWNPSIKRRRDEESSGVNIRIKPVPVLKFSVVTVARKTLQYLGIKECGKDLTVPVVELAFKYENFLVGAHWPYSVLGRGVEGIKRNFIIEGRLRKKLEIVFRDRGFVNGRTIGIHIENSESIKDSDIYFPVELKGRKSDRVIFPSQDEMELFALNLIYFHLEKLQSGGCIIEFDENWPFHVADFTSSSIEAFVKKAKNERFELSLNCEFEGTKIDLLRTVEKTISGLPVDKLGNLPKNFDLENHLKINSVYNRVSNERFTVVPAERLAPIVNAIIELHGKFDFHLAEAAQFSKFADALENCGVTWKRSRELRELGRKFTRLRKEGEFNPPSRIQAEFRPYQKTGYNWLRILAETGFGGVLADDMGLGKTLQALAIIAHKHLELDSTRPSLLVVPTSLVGNWVREIKRFVPELSPIVLHGPKRKKLFDSIPDHHLILSTYPLLHRDHEELFSREYELAVLDEAQAVKNSASQAARLIRNINAKQRIALTGTPVENNLNELWSLFDWLIPGLLGSKKEFGTQFRTPIERHGIEARQRQLSARVSPFLLRRTKEEVESELPPRTEISEIVPLEGSQRDLYDSLVAAMNARVAEAITKKGLQRSRITILDALLKLRQACCDPALVKLNAAKKIRVSAKRQRLLELLEELVSENRKVLVFSQFVEMLNLIRRDIEERGWNYAMLTGSTSKRTEEVSKFQDGDSPIFLISIKAGGVGLNLTAADTVVIYDPWWNPAVERQAMDRAHRIGQDKPVFVYKLIAEGTVEYRIQAMQARKQALADSLYEGGGGISELSERDIEALFKPIS
ncbi:MAG: DEAD/DEAH box helicase [Albidovulum sp.]|nr:DEAD/DEAH box helicase [Albidovulum sp.]